MLRTMLTSMAIVCAVASSASAQTSALDNQLMMQPFYTDGTMARMKSHDEMMAAMRSMKKEDRDTISAECQHDQTNHAEFCNAWMEGMKSM